MATKKCLYVHPYGKHVGEQCAKSQNYGEYCISHKDFRNGQCSALIEQGANKGNRCTRPCEEKSLFCGKHVSAAKLESIKEKGVYKCFKHRCINEVSEERAYCTTCKEKKTEKLKTLKMCSALIDQGPRKGEPCAFRAQGSGKYCEKHSSRSYLLEYAKAVDLHVCGQGKRCANLISKSAIYCETCMEERRRCENARFMLKAADKTLCIDCGKTQTEFAITRFGKPSRYCKDCYIKMRSTEDKRDRTVGKDGFRNPSLYFERYKYDADRRGLEFKISYEEFMSIVSKPCIYCKDYIETAYNGVDRINNDIGYIFENCVTACSLCNLMKSNHTDVEFINHCKAISRYQLGEDSCDSLRMVWKGLNYTSYNEYKKRCIERRELEFELDELYYNELKTQHCYLCGYAPDSASALNGIDRINSKMGYIVANSAPCCVYCNRMKNDTEFELFVEHCHKLASTAESST